VDRNGLLPALTHRIAKRICGGDRAQDLSNGCAKLDRSAFGSMLTLRIVTEMIDTASGSAGACGPGARRDAASATQANSAGVGSIARCYPRDTQQISPDPRDRQRRL